jgi:hypothetical protein
MKTSKIIIIALILLSIGAYGYVYINKKVEKKMVAKQTVLTPQDEILGVWFMENSPTDKIEFLANGEVKVYEDNVLMGTDTYEITNSCDGQTTSNNELFLKRTDGEDGTEYCDYINGINENNSNQLSITPSGSMEVVIYVR